ncbi:unnamed protein product [Candida verbasci]|uniref:Protein MON2 n=1 Tax=Candida verbasci TaxID=1227364 RepID=A0A9W4X999_9ASCO|nr:unnamed protein product [Candida verbasci]
MSSVQSLITDYTGLQTESKRRFSEIKRSCESVIAILKKCQAIKDMDNEQQKKDLLKPLILSCRSGNAKLSIISIPIINKLIFINLISVENLSQLLQSLMEASNLSVDIQLRILQCLPSLMQNYKSEFNGDLLLDLVLIWSNLTSSNKSAVVINTGSATIQQIFTNIYDNISIEPREGSNDIRLENEETVSVDRLSYEGFLIFQDLCNILENEKPTYLKSFHMRTLSVLEIIESILHGHKQLFQNHQELSFLLKTKVIPSLLKILNSSSKNFQLISRTMRIIHVLLSDQLTTLQIESEIILSFVNHLLLDNEIDENQYWEKILVLEMFKSIFMDFSIIIQIFEEYDHNQQKKDVFKELFVILNTFLGNNPQLTNDIVRPPPKSTPNKEVLYLSKSTSSIKTSVLNHLDKFEPPIFPVTYATYLIFQILISYSEGVSNFVSNLSSDSQNIEKDVEFTNSLIESCASEVNSLYKKFIYYSMDEESFRLLIRSLQKYTHTTGLLGLSRTRDSMLMILSKSTINNVTKVQENDEPESLLKEQKKQILAFGESLVDSITSNSTQQSNEVLHTRHFNSRHVICLRALINLAISLGSTLKLSWSVIWITLQWCNSFVYGPDQFSGYHSKSQENFQIMKPEISTQEINSVESLKKKLLESIGESPESSFISLVHSLTDLSDKAFENKQDENSELSLCPYNKSYYLQTFSQICELNALRLIKEDKCWETISSYIISLSCNRKLNNNLRVYVVQIFNKTIESIANTGFNEHQSEDIIKQTSNKSLQALNQYLESLFKMGVPQELLVWNWETEIHLSILTTLHSLIDKYDTYYQHSWNKVFIILNTPFKLSQNANLKDKLQLLVEKSFDTLKLILDEFLLTLPFDQFKYLIDTLIKFCDQKFDLNISFSSVSYFWSISDALKSKIKADSKVPKVNNETEFVQYIDELNDDNYISLDIYLLYSLGKLSKDEVDRAQVRDGSIQTFFQIIESHGEILNKSWDLIYNIVLSNIFKIVPPKKDKDWLETSQLILDGFVNLYNKYVKNDETLVDKWEDLITYLNKLTELKWADLDIIVFKSLQELIKPPLIKNEQIQNSIFQHWSSFNVEYDFINVNYQDSLVQLMNCFPLIYDLSSDLLSVVKIQLIINIFYQCARYPVLQMSQNDTTKATKLQSSIINNFKIIDIDNDEIQSAVIQQLSNIIVLPFGTRSRIEEKLSKNEIIMSKFKIPTFTSISHESLEILNTKLQRLHDFTTLIKDNGVVRVMKSLIEIIENKSVGLPNKKPLWIESNDVLVYIISKLNDHHSLNDEEIWNLINQSINICFSSTEQSQEIVNIEQYNKLTTIILPQLKHRKASVEEFLSNIYLNSFFYDLNADEKSLFDVEAFKDIDIDKFTSFDYNRFFGTTEPLHIYSNRKVRQHCLLELIKFAKQESNLKEASEIYLIKRACFCLRRVLSDLKLIIGCPLPLVQLKELHIILEGFKTLTNISEVNKREFKKLNKVFIKLLPNLHKINDSNSALPQILENYANL